VRQNSNNYRRFVAGAAALVVLWSGRGGAQTVETTTYYAVAAGLAGEPPQLGVRSNLGLALAAGIGKDLSAHSALEMRLGGEFFGAPAQYISPGGCFGFDPCDLPRSSSVRVFTLSGDAVFSRGFRATGPELLIGAGLRDFTETSGAPSELRPYVEAGVGIVRAFGRASVGLDARYQLAASSSALPRWTTPIEMSVRFF
jgi:hypothetical protein